MWGLPGVSQVHSVTAAMARGKRPVTFRTRKLSLSAPMVLPWRRGGRVGRRRTYLHRKGPSHQAGALSRVWTPCFIAMKCARFIAMKRGGLGDGAAQAGPGEAGEDDGQGGREADGQRDDGAV